jgi:outer membrane biosynthesis protein TonB
MRSRRIRGGGAFVALLALLLAVVPAVLKSGDDVSELGGPGRAVLVSLDTPAPGAQPADVPTAGSHWAMVDVADTDANQKSALGAGLLQAILDYVHLLLGQPGDGDLQLPVEGVAGGSGLSVRFTGSASPGETVALGPDGAAVVVTISILTVTTTEPVPPPTTEPPSTTTTTEPPSTTTTTEPPSTTTTAEPPSTTTTAEPPSSSTTTDPSTTTTSTTDPAPSTSTTSSTTTSTTSSTTTTAPPAPGGGDPVTVPATLHVSPQPLSGPRDARLWPFAPDSPWNTPLGDGATFDPRPVVPGPFNISAANGYGVSVGGAGYALVDQPGGEFHYSIYRADGVTVDEYYRYGHANQNAMVTDARGDGVGVGWDTATQLSQLGGLIRRWDLQRGVIAHALQFGAAATILNSTAVWPAKSVDAYAKSNTGFLPYGSLFAIPKDAVMPAGLSPVGEMIWTALRDYGGYIADAQGQVGSPTENFTSLRAEAAADGLVAAIQPDLRKIGPQLRWVTNASRDQVGGPGARLAPLAPDLAGG